MKPGTLWITGDPGVDQLVNSDPLALLVGMLLDQQISIELAFTGPSRLKQRLGGSLDAAEIAGWDPDDFAALCAQKPALHRFPGSMAKRIQAMAAHIADVYDGDSTRLWAEQQSAEAVATNIAAMPGFGAEKTRIFIAVLAKRFGITPKGWQAASAPFSDDQPRSVADMGSEEQWEDVRAWKAAQRAAGKQKTD